MLRETLLTAIFAGFVAALVFTVMQSIWVTPLILQGETYEDRAAVFELQHDSSHPSEARAEAHHEDPAGWKPRDGWQRAAFTFGANLLMGVGYAFVLVAVYLLWREPKGALWGTAYGLAGFVVFFAAPGLGLPPELPGTAAAELTSRQEWWLMTAGATGGALILFFSRPKWWARALALIILVTPHLIPAPQPLVEASLAPAALQSQFRLATTLSNAVFWLSLGLTSSVAFQKLFISNTHVRAWR